MKRRPRGRGIKSAVDVVAALRSPGGCPWDRKQNHRTLRPFLLEETYELLEVLDRKKPPAASLREELGDVLLQVLLHSRLAEERGDFDFSDVASSLAGKLIRRHPHVFGSAKLKTAEDVTERWERIKNEEKRDRRVLDGIPRSLPSLQRASKVIGRVSKVGFQWENLEGPLGKLHEEIRELELAVAELGKPDHIRKGSAKGRKSRERISSEIGDVLFCVANLCYILDVDPEDSLRAMLARFEARFRHVEDRVRKSGRKFRDFTLGELDGFWEEAKNSGRRIK